MSRRRSAILAAVKSLLIAEIFSDPWWRIGPSSALRMATPFPRTIPQVIKIEDEGNHAPYGQASVEQELMDVFRNIAPPPPVHQQQLQLPSPPPSPHPHSTWAKRQPLGSLPGFAGVRMPPLKSPCQRAPPQHVPQPAPNAHRTPATSLPPPQPPPVAAANASQGAVVPLPATNSTVVPRVLQRRSAPKKPPHTAARKKPTVPCGLCGVLCMTARHLKDHEKGRKHRNKAALLAGEMNVLCPVCNVHLSSGLNVEQHLAGKQHLRQLKINGGA